MNKYEEIDNHNENEDSAIQNQFTLEEMKNVVEWVDQHSNVKFATISNRFRKIKSARPIENNDTRLGKLEEIKEFTFNEFNLKRRIEKGAIDDWTLCNSKTTRFELRYVQGQVNHF